MLLTDLPKELLANILSRAGWAPRCTCRTFRRLHDVGCGTLNLNLARSDISNLIELKNVLKRLPQLTTLTWTGARDVVHLGSLAVCSRLQSLSLRCYGSLVSLDTVTELPALSALHFETSGEHIDTTIVAGCSSLAVLSLKEHAGLNSDPLIGCARLVSLNLYGSTLAATAIPLAASCPHLTALDLSSNPDEDEHREVDLARVIGPHTLLRSLRLGSNSNIVNMRTLSQCTALQHLSLTHCRGVDDDWSALAWCVRLTKLNLSWCGPWVTNLGPLAACTGLRHLNLNACYKLTSIAPLAACAAQLTRLDFHSCHRIADLGPLSACSRLTCLDLRGCRKVCDLQPLSTCTALTRLDLRCCRRVRSIAALSACRRLIDLDLTLCPLITDLRPLAALERLEHLHLEGQLVGSVAPLANCVRLTWATISLPRCMDISALSACVNLTNLDLTGCRRLTDISALKACMRLLMLNLAECDNLFASSLRRQFGPPLPSELQALACGASTSLASAADACGVGVRLVDNAAATLASGHVNASSSAGALTQPARALGPPAAAENGACLLKALHAGAAALRAAQSVAAAALREVDTLAQRLAERPLAFVGEHTASGLPITSLVLNLCRSIASAPVAGLEHLKHLDLVDCISLADISALPSCPNLLSVGLNRCTRLFDLRPLSACSSLVTLRLEGCSQIADVAALQPLTRLTTLNLGGLSSLVSLKPLGGMTDLRYLELRRCAALLTLRPLTVCVKLVSIDVRGCKGLADLSPLFSTKQLESLYLDGGNRGLFVWAVRAPVQLKLEQHPVLAKALRDLLNSLVNDGAH